MATTLFITGVTGFLGKVVLEELIRCRVMVDYSKIYVLIRPVSTQSAQHRFHNEVATSLCFSRLPKNWTDDVEVVSCDLSQLRCGVEDTLYNHLCAVATHIIHCAGSVSFDGALHDTVADNVTSTLNILEMARSCQRLRRLVSTSTAYVTPYTDDPIEETLSPLPLPAETLYDLLLDGKTTSDDIVQLTGHPNLYTLTKCSAEHLLIERRGSVPLTIVRPSIISVGWRHPFPGWVDSYAAYTGLIAGVGAGVLRMVSANPNAVLDIVPVDEVARRLLEESFLLPNNTDSNQTSRIVHVVSTIEHGIKVGPAGVTAVDYFRCNGAKRRPKLCIMGSKCGSFEFRLHDALHHRLPLTVAKLSAVFRGKTDQVKRLKRARGLQVSANTVFEPFAHNTYDFRAASRSLSRDFDRDAYSELICRGLHMYLLQRDPSQTLLSRSRSQHARREESLKRGTTHRDSQQQPEKAKLLPRLAAASLSFTFKAIFDRITFDEHSFSLAMEGIDDRTCVVLAPTHRSYLDSLLTSYLIFSRPALGIKRPRIAASREFADVPIVGWFCRRLGTIFVSRGQGKPDPQLDIQLADAVAQGDSIMFFPEGQRSRTGQILPLRRGLLRSLQSTGSEFVVLPVAISYDVVAEKRAFARELEGGTKKLAGLGRLIRWNAKVLCRQVKLGRAHIRCGEALRLNSNTDILDLTMDLAVALRKYTVATTFHLRCFVQQHGGPARVGFDVEWLKAQVEARGGVVLESDLSEEEVGQLDAMTMTCFQYYWEHVFYGDLRGQQPENLALEHYLSQHDIQDNATQSLSRGDGPPDGNPGKLAALLSCLFRPVCEEYTRLGIELKAESGAEIGEKHESSTILSLGVEKPVAERPMCAPLPDRSAVVSELRSLCLNDLENFIEASAWKDVQLSK